MLSAWRRGAIVAVTAGAAVAAQLAAMAPAQAAGAAGATGTVGAVGAAPTVTIAATSRFLKITNDVFVVYRAGAYSNATIHGTISGGSAGEIATLFAQQFPFRKPAVKAGSITLTAATTNYSFTVTPNLYTKYAVRVFASKTATTALASSGARDVYILSNGSFNKPQSCVEGTCHVTFRVYWNVPPSTLSTEIGKHVYPYFAVNLNATKIPPPPNYLSLNGGHASVAKARRINDYTYETTVSFWFSFGREYYDFVWTACGKDTVYKDGLGLPGSHSCGLSRIPRTVGYLG